MHEGLPWKRKHRKIFYCVYLMNTYSGNETVNLGTGKELTIRELTELVAKVMGEVELTVTLQN